MIFVDACVSKYVLKKPENETLLRASKRNAMPKCKQKRTSSSNIKKLMKNW